VFALQTLGIEVDPLNTVQFSNNTGYPSFAGQVLSGDDVWTVFQGLLANNIANYTHLLTGYSKSPSSLRTLVQIRKKLREMNPALIHVCDPVMGDNGKLYVSEELVEIYKKEVIPGADFLKPNQTECEYLTGIKITNERDALQAIDILHSWGVQNIVVSSLNLPANTDVITVICSTKPDQQTAKRFRIQVPKQPEDKGNYTGTGDLFSALLLGWSIRSLNFSDACEKAVATLQAVLTKTYQERLKGRGMELQLIQSKKEIENPVVVLHAEVIE